MGHCPPPRKVLTINFFGHILNRFDVTKKRTLRLEVSKSASKHVNYGLQNSRFLDTCFLTIRSLNANRVKQFIHILNLDLAIKVKKSVTKTTDDDDDDDVVGDDNTVLLL